MQQTVGHFLLNLPLFIITAIVTHLVISFAQTFMHYKIAHNALGGKLFRNHVNFHHTYYSTDHLVSKTYLGDEGNNTPFFIIPIFLVGVCTYFLLPFDLFVVQAIACAASFYAHIFFDKEYHVDKSWLQRFAWFRRKQELHFVHHHHANSNFAVIDFFWDRLLGTYRKPEPPIPLLDPYEIAKEGPTQMAAMAKWAKVVEAVGKILKVDFDKACTDPARLFYAAARTFQKRIAR
jgi:sterol desaturase/sphingolipid hydroxylase (fatty acid hydroxylase superfamily)